MSRVIGTVIVLEPFLEIGSRHYVAKRLSRWASLEGTINLLCDIENRLDASESETGPVRDIFLRTEPDARKDLYRAIGVRRSGGLVLVLPMKSR